MHAQLLHLCLTLCNPKDRSLPCSSVHGIFTAKILEWVAMPSSTVFSHSGFKTVSPEFPASQVDSLLLSHHFGKHIFFSVVNIYSLSCPC